LLLPNHFPDCEFAVSERLSASLRRLGDAGEDLEQDGLPRPVAADDANDFAVLYFEETSFKAQMVLSRPPTADR